ncbi:MAG: hypothetical protein JXR05_09625 [Flavobacteriaceae bacterium]
MKKITRGLLCSLMVLFLVSCSNESIKPESIENRILELLENSSLDRNVLIITKITDDEIEYVIKDGFEYGFTNKAIGDEICRGQGLSYARCLNNAWEAGLCLLTYKDGDDFVAEEAECPSGGGSGVY